MCEYAYYNDKETFRAKLYCGLQKGKPCIYSRFCVRTNKFVPNDKMETCFMAIEKKKKDIPNESYYVRFVRKGYLYVEIDGKVVKVKDTIGNVNNYVYLRVKDGGYEASLTPFVEEVEVKDVETEDINDEINTAVIVGEGLTYSNTDISIIDYGDDKEETKEIETEEEKPEEEVVKLKKKRRYNRKKKSDD